VRLSSEKIEEYIFKTVNWAQTPMCLSFGSTAFAIKV